MSFDYRINPDEDKYQYEWRIFKHKKFDDDCTEDWDQIAQIMNNELQTSLSEKSYRNEYNMVMHFWQSCFSDKEDVETPLTEEDEKLFELRKERFKLADERRAGNKTIRQLARQEEKLDKLAVKLSDIGSAWWKPKRIATQERSDKELVILLSDWHVGIQFDNIYGRYSIDIARDRIEQLLQQVRETNKIYKAKKCTVALLGDMISGNIHRPIDMQNQQHVIDQLKHAIEMISGFIVQLTDIVDDIDIVSVCGNHSRVSAKDDSAIGERLDDMIPWTLDLLFETFDNVNVLKNDNNTIGEALICGKKFMFVHGDMDKFSYDGVAKLMLMVKEIPYCICAGHMHHPLMTTINGINCIQSGCLCGTGDDYTISKRLSGVASQTILICDENGIKGYYPVMLE